MNSETVFKDLYNYIDSYELVYSISKTYKTKIKESIELIKSHIDILDQEKTIENFNPKTSPKVIEECLNYLNLVIIENKPNEQLNQFCKDYCFLTSNWNNNVLKNEIFHHKIQTILRIINKELTFNDHIRILKHLNKRVNNQLAWRPPSFELSQHYYNLLKE